MSILAVDLTVAFSKTHTSILSDVDYWLISYLGMKEAERKKVKFNFAKALVGSPATAETVAEIAFEHFSMGVLKSRGKPPTAYVKSEREWALDLDTDRIVVALNFENIFKVISL